MNAVLTPLQTGALGPVYPFIPADFPIKPGPNALISPDGQLVTDWVEITQAIAEEILLKWNEKNRSLIPSSAAGMSRDMAKSKWPHHHQGIAFRIDGNTADGQNRLEAIRLSGVSQWFLVTWGLSDEAMQVIDGARPRTFRDVMKIAHGENIGYHVIATARGFVHGFAHVRNVPLTNSEMTEVLRTYGPAIQFAETYLTTKPHKTGVSASAVCSVIARAYYYADHERLRRFCEALKTSRGNPLPFPAGDGIAIENALKLRDLLVTHGVGGGHQERQVAYRKMEYALFHYLRDEPKSKLYQIKAEPWPLPSPEEARAFVPGTPLVPHLKKVEEDSDDEETGELVTAQGEETNGRLHR